MRGVETGNHREQYLEIKKKTTTAVYQNKFKIKENYAEEYYTER